MINLDKLTNNYLDFCKYQKNLNQKTLKAYRIDLNQFTFFINENKQDLNKTSISAYITHLHKNYKLKTIKRKIACLKAFFNYLEYEEVIENNPLAKMKIRFQEPTILPKTISLITIQTILSAAYQELHNENNTIFYNKVVTRDIAVLELLFASGVRVSELCSLTVENVDLCEGYIKIYGKGSKERIIQLGNEDVLQSLKRYKQAFSIEENGHSFFFLNRLHNRLSEQSVRFMINKYVKMSGVPIHITPHMYRHSFATLLLEEDVDIRYIQQLLGHSSILTTQIYTHVTTNKQRSILVSKHPRNKLILNKG